jgi:hypothetical protein
MKGRLLPFLLFSLFGLSTAALPAMEYLAQFSAEERVAIYGVAADRVGNTYACGFAGNLAGSPGAIRIGVTNATEWEGDAFVIKFAADGTRAATVLFGGEGLDLGYRVAVDSSGNVVVLGSTTSRSFPLVNALQSSMEGSGELFLAKFDSSCTNLIFCTYLGGRDYEFPSALGLDEQGAIFFAGQTSSDDFPSGPEAFPWRYSSSAVFVAKLSSDGSRLHFAKRFGGSAYDVVNALAVDREGNAYLTGSTSSADFPTLNALQPMKYSTGSSSAFVTKIASDGTTLFSTFLAGDYADTGNAMAVNTAGEIFVAGVTYSKVFPVSSEAEAPSTPPNAASRGFLVKLNATGTGILATNFYSFSGNDPLSTLALAPNETVVGAGNIGGLIGLPFFVSLDEDGATSISVGRTECAPMAEVNSITLDTAGRLVVAGRESNAEYPLTSYYVARYEAGEWPGPSPVQVRVLSPFDGATLSSRQPASLRAVVTGATGAVASVKFYDGRRLIGLATNSPFEVTWKTVSPRAHSLTAVANVDGRTVTSCVVRVTAASPRNDHFARRILLKGENIEAIGRTVGATAEEELQYSSRQSVWYTWKAPREGIYRLEVSDTASPKSQSYNVGLYSGTRLKSLVTLVAPYGPSTTLRARRGDVFQIQVSSFFALGGEFRLQLRRVTPPGNDSFTNATVLNGESLEIPTTIRHATGESRRWYAVPDHGYAGEATIWFEWTAPSSGLFLAKVTGAGYPPMAECYTGSSISNLVSAGQNISGETNGVAFYAQAGTRYFLSLRGDNTNDLTLSIGPHSPPPNDTFANRFTIPFGSYSAMGSLIGATMEPGEPGRRYGGSPSDASAWWTWRPETAGVYQVTFTLFTTPFFGERISGGVAPAILDYSRQIEVYTGNAIAELASVSSGTADGVFRAVEGTSYQIVIRGGFARFAVNIRPIAAPSNDNFAAAIALAGARVVKSGSTIGATTEADEPERGIPWPGLNNDSVWYRWTAPSNGLFSISAASGGFLYPGARLLEIYEGEELANLDSLASGSDSHLVQVIGGKEYRLAVIDAERFTLEIRPAQRPANDDFANRKSISGLHVWFGGDAKDATGEPAEPLFQGYYPARHSIWFSWTAPTNGSYLLRTTNSGQPILSVYTGDTLDALTSVASGQNYFGIELTARAGITYQIAVEPSSYLYQTQLGFELRYQPPPRNDNFANRLRLKGTLVSITASNVGATLESGEPLNSPNTSGQTVWWTWRAPRTGQASFEVGNFGGPLGVYTGNWPTRLSALTDTNSYDAAHNLRVQSGVDYQISVDGYRGNSSGPFQLRIHYTTAPLNDNFAQRQLLADLASGDLEGGSLEIGEPKAGFSTETSSTWWTWMAPSNGTYRFAANAQTYGCNVALFTGNALSDLQAVALDPSYPSSFVYAQVTTGITYVVRVFGKGTENPYTLTSQFAPAPVNDAFAGRTVLTGTNISVVGSNRTATAEGTEPAHNGTIARKSVWWSWTAPASGSVQIGFSGYSHKRIAIYTGNSLELLQPIASGYGGVTFNGVQATTYQVVIDTEQGGTSGSDEFIWWLTLEGTTIVSPGLNPTPIVDTPPSLLQPVIRLLRLESAAAANAMVTPGMIETSTNLVDWIPYTNAPANSVDFRVVPSTNEPYRFFRVR